MDPWPHCDHMSRQIRFPYNALWLAFIPAFHRKEIVGVKIHWIKVTELQVEKKNLWIIFLTPHSTPSGSEVIKHWRFILMCKNPTLFLWEMVKESLGGPGIVYIYQVKCCLLTNKLHKYFSLLLKGTKKRSNFAILEKSGGGGERERNQFSKVLIL